MMTEVVAAARSGRGEVQSYFIETWGCQMNVLDSQLMDGLLQARGMVCADRAELADVVVLNTCSVREKAVQKVLSRLGELHRARREGGRPHLIGLCGCVAEQEGLRLLEKNRALSFVIGPGKIAQLPAAISAAAHGERSRLIGFSETRDYDSHLIARGSVGRHYVTAIHGCDQYCTFCVVPYTRGREISRTLPEIVLEVTTLARDGAVEITLLGQTVNAYSCPETGSDFADLLEAVAAVEGVRWVQFLTSHPRFFPDKLVDALGRLPRLGTYLHLPFQAGSDRILQAMHRRYSRSEYLELVARIRASRPETVISTDVIVGFPGETEHDFEQTLAMVEEIRFGQVFGFIFSPRPKTPAARYGDRVSRAVAGKRLERLFELQASIQLGIHQSLIGMHSEILLDGVARRGGDQWQGRGADNRVVNIPGRGEYAPGQIIPVTIVGATTYALLGEATTPAPSPVTHPSDPVSLIGPQA